MQPVAEVELRAALGRLFLETTKALNDQGLFTVYFITYFTERIRTGTSTYEAKRLERETRCVAAW